jgi:hypothetical protein
LKVITKVEVKNVYDISYSAGSLYCTVVKAFDTIQVC